MLQNWCSSAGSLSCFLYKFKNVVQKIKTEILVNNGTFSSAVIQQRNTDYTNTVRSENDKMCSCDWQTNSERGCVTLMTCVTVCNVCTCILRVSVCVLMGSGPCVGRGRQCRRGSAGFSADLHLIITADRTSFFSLCPWPTDCDIRHSVLRVDLPHTNMF